MKRQIYGLLAAAAAAVLISGCGTKKTEQETSSITETSQEISSEITSAGTENKETVPESKKTASEAEETVSDQAESDEMFSVSGIGKEEADTFIKTFVSHLEAEEKKEAAEMILYPRKVTVPDGDLIVHNADEFLDYYDDIFTDDFIELLKEDSKKELNFNYQGVWIGNGELWVMKSENRMYVNSIFNGEDRSVKYEGEPGVQPG
ncbi:hypothetical protein C0033_05170 [Clostridium sp. chh4-2]|uniref:hypothetical protein n=1 Tax=Clostridium sp. chh4-2 TaxID=2067550 RepID=UPI000CCDBBA9|nr:hypothetical protein [Clostridium sp. chh4-2]PNV62928.1 hypothetical protein C0033_05170 [Clostridium sp. chh4-2]